MNSSTPYTISQLAGRFGSRNFTPDMRQCAGGNEAGLKKFLQKYPSLFAVNGNLVRLQIGTFFFCNIPYKKITLFSFFVYYNINILHIKVKTIIIYNTSEHCMFCKLTLWI